MGLHVTEKVIFERAIARLVETHDDGHHFAQTQACLTPSLPTPIAEKLLSPQGLKPQTEVVNVTEQGYNLHDENLLGRTVWVALTTLLKRFLVAYPCRYA